MRNLRSLIVLGVVLSFLLACGSPTPGPEVVVVTNTFTPEPVVKVVTATFTPTPEVIASDTPLPSSSATTEKPVLEFMTYEHSSGAFSLDIPEESSYSDDDEGVYITYDESLVIIFFSILEAPLDSASLQALVPTVLDEALIGEGLISSYENLEVESQNDMVSAAFNISSEQFSDGEGELILRQLDQTLYFMVLLTPSYNDVKEVWQAALDTMMT
ncbi:MAG: hypothetical protein PVH17_10980, partial [Anaerolineae bacterium]